MTEAIKTDIYQYSLDGEVVPVVINTGCAWCRPLTDLTTHRICPQHRDEFYLKALDRKLELVEINQTHREITLLSIKKYLASLRGDSHGPRT